MYFRKKHTVIILSFHMEGRDMVFGFESLQWFAPGETSYLDPAFIHDHP